MTTVDLKLANTTEAFENILADALLSYQPSCVSGLSNKALASALTVNKKIVDGNVVSVSVTVKSNNIGLLKFVVAKYIADHFEVMGLKMEDEASKKKAIEFFDSIAEPLEAKAEQKKTVVEGKTFYPYVLKHAIAFSYYIHNVDKKSKFDVSGLKKLADSVRDLANISEYVAVAEKNQKLLTQ